MARYRKVQCLVWNDEKFRELSRDGKLAFLFLLTHPHMTMLGAMRSSLPGLADELGVSVEAFREVLGKGLARSNERACVVWLPNFLKHNPPESPNVVKAWPTALELIPECDIKVAITKQLKEYAKVLPEGFRKGYAKVFPKTLPNQEQEQEQEQELKATPPAPMQPYFETSLQTPGRFIGRATDTDNLEAGGAVCQTMLLAGKSNVEVATQQVANCRHKYKLDAHAAADRIMAAWEAANPRPENAFFWLKDGKWDTGVSTPAQLGESASDKLKRLMAKGAGR